MTTISRRWTYARSLWACSRGLTALCLALTLAVAASGTGALVSTGRLVQVVADIVGGGRQDPGSAYAWLLVTAALFVVSTVAASALTFAGQALAARYLAYVTGCLAELGMSPATVAHLEDPGTKGDFDKLASAPADWLFLAGVQATWTLLAARLSGCGAFVLLATWSPVVALLVAVGWMLVSRTFGRWADTIFDDLLEVTGKDRRRADYFRQLLLGAQPAREIRLFGLAPWLLDRYRRAWHESMAVVWRNRDEKFGRSLAMLAVALLANGVAVLSLGADAWSGAVPLGQLTTLAQAVLALSALGPQTDPQTSLSRTTAVSAEIHRLVRERAPGSATTTSAAVRRSGTSGVRIEGLSFAYPGSGRPLFDSLSLEVPAGQSISVVGVNGVGKSTLIKLLCGLYEPSGGRVLVCGSPPADSRQRGDLAVIQQRFTRYSLSLQDNVAAGAVDRRDDLQLLRRAVADAGASDLAAALPHGWQTTLSPEFRDGADLSGGQWQKIALARAFAALHAGASVLILDEPTAALDIRAEAELFDRFLDVTRGATTILVTHRLSSVRRTDRIVVLDRDDTGVARIAEDGPHDSLMAAGGLYSRLFTAQAARAAGGVSDGVPR